MLRSRWRFDYDGASTRKRTNVGNRDSWRFEIPLVFRANFRGGFVSSSEDYPDMSSPVSRKCREPRARSFIEDFFIYPPRALSWVFRGVFANVKLFDSSDVRDRLQRDIYFPTINDNFVQLNKQLFGIQNQRSLDLLPLEQKYALPRISMACWCPYLFGAKHKTSIFSAKTALNINVFNKVKIKRIVPLKNKLAAKKLKS